RTAATLILRRAARPDGPGPADRRITRCCRAASPLPWKVAGARTHRARVKGEGWPMGGRDESENPLRRMEDWEGFGEARYPPPGGKPREDYRDFDDPARDTVRDFYRLNHSRQTYDFVLEKKRQFLRLDRRQMTVLEALDWLDTLVDDSDPDTALS